MDNLTHSLLGALLAESAYQGSLRNQEPSTSRRHCFYIASLLANNFPDMDLLYLWITPGTLGYLLHHRGHTHTLLLLLPQWFFCLCCLKLYSRWSTPWKTLKRKDWHTLYGLFALGLLAHLFLDGCNSYGIHPYYPFNNRWYYGDTLFIIEPLLWVILGTTILSCARLWFWKIALCFPLILIPFWGWNQQFLPLLPLLWIYTLFISLLLLFHFCRIPQRLILCALLTLLLLGGLRYQSLRVKAEVKAYLQTHHPASELLDVVANVHPGNPWRWSILTVEREKTFYRSRNGTYSFFPTLFPPINAPFQPKPSGVPLQAPSLPSTPVLQWNGEYQAPLALFHHLFTSHCHFHAWMRFVRVPSIQGNQLNDLRYSLQNHQNFSTFTLPDSPHPCPSWIPPWIPPRQDLFDKEEKQSEK